jgi:hypothetical protein
VGPHLDDAFLKLARARTHLKALQSSWEAFVKTEPYTITEEIETDGTQYVMRIRILAEPPREWSLIIGDFVHALRTSLDHVAYALAWKKLDADPGTKSEFPICKDESVFARDSTQKKFALFPDEAREVAIQIQPFKLKERGEAPENAALWVIHDLDTIDKHRRLHVVNTSMWRGSLGISTMRDVNVRMDELVTIDGPVKDRDVLAQMAVEVTGPNPKLDVNTQPTIAVTIGYDAPGFDLAIPGVCAALLKEAELVVRRFERFLP